MGMGRCYDRILNLGLEPVMTTPILEDHTYGYVICKRSVGSTFNVQLLWVCYLPNSTR